MTTDPTPDPTPLGWLNILDDFAGMTDDKWTALNAADAQRSANLLRAFLQSPAVMALSDPKLRAAAEVVIGRLPDLLGMEAKATPGPWTPNRVPETDGWGSWGAGPLCEPATHEEVDCEDDQLALSQNDAELISAARNALHEASQAAKDRQVYDQSYKGEAKHE